VLQQVLNTVEKAFVGMWEQGRGFPRFKKLGRMRSLLFPQFALSPISGESIELPKLGRIRIRLHRPIPELVCGKTSASGETGIWLVCDAITVL